MIPLYGFLAGDTIGLLVFAKASDTVEEIARKLEMSTRVHAASPDRVRVLCRGRDVPLWATVRDSGIRPLERFDVVCGHEDELSLFPFEEDVPFDRFDAPEEPEPRDLA